MSRRHPAPPRASAKSVSDGIWGRTLSEDAAPFPLTRVVVVVLTARFPTKVMRWPLGAPEAPHVLGAPEAYEWYVGQCVKRRRAAFLLGGAVPSALPPFATRMCS